jgi:hypothetical protein
MGNGYLETHMNSKLSAIFVLSAALLAACSSEEPTPTPVPRAPAANVQTQAAKPADPTAKMARAVTAGKASAPIELKYDVLVKPQPGEPIEIDLALIPGANADSIAVAVTATPGLEIVSAPNATFGPLKAGEVANHKITARAAKIDVVYITVTATVTAIGTTQARAFAIPLIIGDPVTVAPSDASAKPDATGQKVQGMPAKESK